MKRSQFVGLGIVLTAVLLATPVWAQVTLPHTFSANTPANAAEVNENFQALANAIPGSGTPITGAYSGLQYTGGTAAVPNVVVMQGSDGNGITYYSVRLSYLTGTVAGATYAYVRELIYLSDDGGVVTGTSLRQGTNAINPPLGTNELWATEVHSWADGTPITATQLTDTRTDEYLCYSAAVSGQWRHCRRRIRDTGIPTRLEDDSRLLSLVGSFTVGSITFTSGGLAGSYLSGTNARDYFVVAKDFGIVVETRRVRIDVNPVTNLAYPVFVGHYVVYFRVNSITAGTVAGTIFDSGGDAEGVFFTP